MAIGDIYKATVLFTNGDTSEALSFGIYGRQAAGGPTLANVGDDVKDWWNTGSAGANAQKTLHHTAISLAAVHLRKWDPLAPIDEIYTTGLPIVATGSAQPVPPQDAVLVSLRTANIGKSYRGRVYLPPLDAAQIATNGNIVTATAQNIGTNFTGLRTLLAADDFIPVVYSKVLSLGTDITANYVDLKVRTQRRRTNRAPSYA